MITDGLRYLVVRYVTSMTSNASVYTREDIHQISRSVLLNFRATAKKVDKLPQPSKEHEMEIVALSSILQGFADAIESWELLTAKMNPAEKKERFEIDAAEEREKARTEETNKKFVSSVRKRRKTTSTELDYDPESKSRVKTVKHWISKDVVASIPVDPPYPAFFFKKLSRPCIVRKIPPAQYGKKKDYVYICIFDNGDVSYLATDMTSSAEDKVRANLRELRTRGHTRKTYSVAEIEEGLLERGFDPAQVREIAEGHMIAETKQFWLSTGAKVFVKSIPPGKPYDEKLGIILGMRLSMTEHPVDVISFVGETTGKSHNVRVFKVFLEDEKIYYVWGEEIHRQVGEGTHESLLLDQLYERLVERKKEEADTRMQEFIGMIHEDIDEDDLVQADEIPERRISGADNFKYRVRRLVKDD